MARKYLDNVKEADLRRSVRIDSVTVPIPTSSAYVTNHLDEASGSITYIGKETDAGVYLITKLDESGDPELVATYATISNNSGETTYASAWTNRATLTYDTWATAAG